MAGNHVHDWSATRNATPGQEGLHRGAGRPNSRVWALTTGVFRLAQVQQWLDAIRAGRREGQTGQQTAPGAGADPSDRPLIKHFEDCLRGARPGNSAWAEGPDLHGDPRGYTRTADGFTVTFQVRAAAEHWEIEDDPGFRKQARGRVTFHVQDLGTVNGGAFYRLAGVTGEVQWCGWHGGSRIECWAGTLADLGVSAEGLKRRFAQVLAASDASAVAAESDPSWGG
jgi:hypothetical protein